jgi:deoxycytidylate deaminase
MLATLCLACILSSAQAAPKGKPQQAQKERLVLMPLRVPEEDKALQGAMETALVEGLQQKYEVFSGERVTQKARQIFMKESQSAKKECDETRCMQGIAEAFQAELIATANVTKKDGGYFLALSVQNIFDNLVVYSKSTPCKNCDSFQVVDKLKELVGASATSVQSSQSSTAMTEPIKINPPAVPVAPTVKGLADDADSQTWVEIVKGNTAEDYKMYLDSFPQGKYAEQAAEQKKNLEDYAKAKAEEQEDQAWSTAQQVDTENGYLKFLKQYPKGRYVVLGKVKLKKIQDAEQKRLRAIRHERQRVGMDAGLVRQQPEWARDSRWLVGQRAAERARGVPARLRSGEPVQRPRVSPRQDAAVAPSCLRRRHPASVGYHTV